MPTDIIRIPFEEKFESPVILTDQQEEKIEQQEENTDTNVQNLLNSPSYSLAFLDHDFIRSNYARSIRLQLEMEKPEWFMRQYGIRSTVIVFGSARFISRKKAARLLAEAEENLALQPDNTEFREAVKAAKLHWETSIYYEQAREFARIVSEDNVKRSLGSDEPFDYVICTGGGPGIMEAANRGAHEAGAPTIGLNIKLPYEQRPNPYVSPQLCFQFHYFNVRKLHFMLRAKALVVCPGGFGTFDEFFEGLTLRQTERMQQIPIILLGTDFWQRCVNFDYLVETGVINRGDLELFHLTDSPQEAWNMIKAFYR
ncbi:MAG: LOG family protein [Planctomycetaceae bacterium]|jgi:uncharacterized protein (TIGR00730 family)|nr:LOG family protein [Planctomycetaceae bacterium]